MASINGLGGSVPVGRLNGAAAPRPAAETDAVGTPARAGDRVELSGIGSYLAALKSNDVRPDKVAAARSAIEAGTYEDDHKLNVAVDRLLSDLAL